MKKRDKNIGWIFVSFYSRNRNPVLILLHSEAFDMDLKYFINAATFVQRVKVTSAKAKLVGYVEYMSCSGGQCTPPAEADFSFDLTK